MKQILLNSTLGNVQGTVWRICILMLRWKWSKRTNYDLHNPRTTAESMKSSLAFSNELNCSLQLVQGLCLGNGSCLGLMCKIFFILESTTFLIMYRKQGKYNMAKFYLDTFLCYVIIHYNSQVQGQVGFIFSSHILVSVLYQLYIVTIFQILPTSCQALGMDGTIPRR